MSTESHYDHWSAQYDTNANKTRDLEAIAIRKLLAGHRFHHVLEIGAGTGKNTVWLAQRAEKLLAVDLSAEMLAKAREKIAALDAMACEVLYLQADVLQPWRVAAQTYDLVSFSLVLEHIRDLQPIFKEVDRALVAEGYVYVGELHPFKQYAGSKARYITEAGEQVVDCHIHHMSDFVQAAQAHGIALVALDEFFDDNDRTGLPRILGMVFQKR